ncbi:MAG: glycosyltransferase family 4 protein [Eubacteriales bacterium]
MPKNILYLIGGGEIGGAEIHILGLINNLDRNNYSPYLGYLIKNGPLATDPRLRHTPSKLFSMHFPADISPLPSLIKYCKKNSISLIHAHGIRANLLGRLTAQILKIPCISTIHSDPAYDYPASWKGRLALFTETLTLPLSSGLITVSNSIRKNYSVRIPLLNSLNFPIQTIYNCCPPICTVDNISLRNNFRMKWNISQDSIVVGTIGRLHRVKGQIYLIKALIALVSKIPHIHFVLVGEGILYKELHQILDSSNLPYTMTGFLSDAKSALPALDVFVLPSLSEGMGIVLLEAMQAAIPIVASDTGGIAELLNNNIDSLLTPPGDIHELENAIYKISSDSELSQKLTSNAKKRVISFSLERMLSETQNFYYQILNPKLSS